MNKIIDAITKTISLFSPKTARNYYAGHLQLSSLYKAGSLQGPNGRFGLGVPQNKNLAIAQEAKLIRQRARLLVNDAPNINGAVRKIVNNVVYNGIILQVKNAKSERKEKLIEKTWKEWAKSQNLWLLQRQVLRHLIIDGGCLVHFYIERENKACPLGIELINIDRLDETKNGRLENGNFAFKGIEFDSNKNVIAYHIKEDDEYAYYMGIRTQFAESKRISKENIFLCYLQEDIGQLLPVSWLHAVIMTMQSFNEYQLSEQIAAQLAASFGIFLKQNTEYTGTGLDGTSLMGGAVNGKPLNINDFISSGRIDVLPAGTEIQVAQNTRPSSNYSNYSKQCQKNASTGIGMSYESFSNDFSEASYSSVRQAILEERRNYQVIQEMIVQFFLQPVWEKFEEIAKTFSVLPNEEISICWQRPGWQWVDPVKDSQAQKTLNEMKIKSGHMIAAEMGIDYDEVQAQIEKEQANNKTDSSEGVNNESINK